MHAVARDDDQPPPEPKQGFFSAQMERIDAFRDSIDQVITYADCSHTSFESATQAVEPLIRCPQD